MASVENVLDLARAARIATNERDFASRDPRQVCIVHEDDLEAQAMRPEQARVNLVLRGGSADVLRSGALLEIGNTRIRIAFKCEPCAHGAQLADVPMTRFRNLKRYLGLVITDDSAVALGSPVSAHPDMFEAWEDDFRGRVTRALRFVPDGQQVLSTELLFTIGASKGYARALPRWVAFSEQRGVRPGVVKYLNEFRINPNTRTYPLAQRVWGKRISKGASEDHTELAVEA